MTMSDKIAVMNDGQIEQVGTPQEVYLEPENQFVAQFIGSPEVNLLDVSVVSIDQNEAVVDVEGGPRLSFDISEYLPERGIEDAVLAFRPRKVKASEGTAQSGIETTVSLHEPLGDEVLMYLDGPQGELRAVVPLGEEIDEGDTATIRPDVGSLYLFNANTGERFARGDQNSQQTASVDTSSAAGD